MFLVLHTYKEEEMVTVIRGGIMLLEAIPADMKLISVYSVGPALPIPKPLIVCIWEAESKEALEKFFEPITFMKTEVLPAFQFYPPSPGLYALLNQVSAFETAEE